MQQVKIKKIPAALARLCGWRLWAGLALTLLLVPALAAPAPARAAPGQGKPIQVLIHKSFFPDMFLDSNGKPAGFAVDLLNHLAGQLGWRLKYRAVDSWNEISRTNQGTELVLVPSSGILPGREKLFDYTRPFGAFPISVFMRSSSPTPAGEPNLNGLMVGVVENNVGQKIMQKSGWKNCKVYDCYHSALFALLAGEVDAIVYPRYPLEGRLRAIGLDGKLNVVGKPLREVKRGISLTKGHPKLLAQLDGALAEFMSTPRFRSLWAKWHPGPKPFWDTGKVALLGGMVALLAVFGMALWRYNSISRLNKRLAASLATEEAYEAELTKHRDQLELMVKERTRELEDALANIKSLSGLLPICASCKSIRDDEGYWHQVEEYIHTHSEAELSHGICPRCMEKLYPEYAKKINHKLGEGDRK